jgi:IMP dehydrogenase/GMP reductase
MNAKLDFDDILIVPEMVTSINSRSEITVRDEHGFLPIFTAPMDTVVNTYNMGTFLDNGIRVCLPRIATPTPNHYSVNENVFCAYSLSDFQTIFLGDSFTNPRKTYALIDVANGHMPAVLQTIRQAKAKYGDNMCIMVGNIANPETYRLLSDAGADFIRVGIGNGGGCLTTQQTGVGYPMASLIKEVKYISERVTNPAKIVADGGFKKYSDVIKALALGADYVMLGSILNKSLESAGENYVQLKEGDDYTSYSEFRNSLSYSLSTTSSLNDLMADGLLYKKFRGMSTKEAQQSLGNKTLKTSEGIVTYHRVEYTLKGWVENFEHYLKSAMSYTDSINLHNFIGEVDVIQISENSFKRYNK